jgi:hypothetical protein
MMFKKSLSFILERVIFCLDEIKDCKSLEIIEKRGRKEVRKVIVIYRN